MTATRSVLSIPATPPSRPLDDTDWQILALLQENGRRSNAEIARQVGMAPSATLERIRKLEESGVIAGYRSQIDPRAIGLGLLAFVFVRANELPREEATGLALSRLDEVLEVHHIAGEDCYLAKVRVADAAALGRLLRQKFGAIPTITSTRSTIVMDTIKEWGRLPMPTPEAEASDEPAEAAVGGAP